MSLTALLAQTATATLVSTSTTLDDMGDPATATTTATYRCLLQQSSRREDTANRDVQIGDWNLYLEPAAAVLEGGDRVEIDGVSYELDGPPWPTFHPRTRSVQHVEASVKRVT